MAEEKKKYKKRPLEIQLVEDTKRIRSIRKDRMRKARWKHKKKVEYYATLRQIYTEHGDTYGDYYICIAKNGNMKRHVLFHTDSLNEAKEKFDELVKENHEGIVFRKDSLIYNRAPSRQNRKRNFLNKEIVLYKKLKAEPKMDKVFIDRDKYGKFRENVVTNDRKVEILNKQPYYIEETFCVYGKEDQKVMRDYNYVLNEVMFDGEPSLYNPKMVRTLGKVLIIRTDGDLDVVKCKSPEQVQKLKAMLEIDTIKRGCGDYVMFGGEVPLNMRDYIMERVMEKTGWNSKRNCFIG